MDEHSSLEMSISNSLSEQSNRTSSPDHGASAEIHPVISNAEILNSEDDSRPNGRAPQEPSIPSSPPHDIDEDTDLDIFYDLSHVSHDYPIATSNQEQASNDSEDPSTKSVEHCEQEQLPENEGSQSLAEVEVWAILDSTGTHLVATIDPNQVPFHGNAIIDHDNPVVREEIVNPDATETLNSGEQPSVNEEASIWLIILALTVWCCFLIILIWLICMLVHSTNWNAIFTAVALPLLPLSGGFSLKQAKGVDFVAGAVIAPAFIAFANFTWFKIGRRLSPKTNVTTEIPKEYAGSFNLIKLLIFVKTSRPQMIFLAILLLSSAVASTLLSNILGYKAIPTETPKSASTELIYQIVYIPGLLLPALCAITSASTAALLLVILEWKSALLHRKQASEAAKPSQNIVTDEHDMGCEEEHRGHNYVSFPRFRTGRRLFSRGGIEIFSGASGDGENEPLLRRTRSQVEGRSKPGSWRLPSFGFPSLKFAKKSSDLEAQAETGVVPSRIEQPVGTPRDMLPAWKFSHASLPVWSRSQSSPAIIQQEAILEHSVEADPTNTPAVEYARKGRKFWKLPTYGSIPSSRLVNQTTEPEWEATQSSAVPDQTSFSLWNLPFPGRFLWPSGNWRSERQNRRREDASDTTSLLSSVEPDQVSLPQIPRTPSFWKFSGPAGHYTAPGAKVLRKTSTLTDEPTSILQSRDHSDITSYASESWRSWMIPKFGFVSSSRVSSAQTSTIPQEAEEQPSCDPNDDHATTSKKGRKSHKRDYSSSFSWFPSFKFPVAGVDVTPPKFKQPNLLPAFEENQVHNVASSSRIMTASKALNVAIQKQPMPTTSGRSEQKRNEGNQTSSKAYISTETMNYQEAEAASSIEQVESVHPKNNDSKRPAVAPKTDIPHSQNRSTSWMHMRLFATKNESAQISKSSQPLTPIQKPNDEPPLEPPAIVRPSTKKGKEREQYVDQFESTIERLHNVDNPVTIHEESVIVQPTKLYTENDIITQKKNLGIGSNPWGSRRSRSHDIEAARTCGVCPTRTTSPYRKVAGSFQQGGSEAGGSSKDDQASWKGWTWWDVSWPHLVDIDTSRPVSTNASSRQVSASSKTSTNDSQPPDLEAQKPTPESRVPKSKGDVETYARKRPLWGLGRGLYPLPSLSPLSVVLPGCLSPASSSPIPDIQDPEPGEASSSRWYSSEPQLLLEGPRGKEPMKRSPPMQWPDHQFRPDEHTSSFLVEEGAGSQNPGRTAKIESKVHKKAKGSVRDKGEELGMKPGSETKEYLGL